MNLLDIDKPGTVLTNHSYKTYLDFANQCFQRSVEWQRRGAAWHKIGMNELHRSDGVGREPLPRPQK